MRQPLVMGREHPELEIPAVSIEIGVLSRNGLAEEGAVVGRLEVAEVAERAVPGVGADLAQNDFCLAVLASQTPHPDVGRVAEAEEARAALPTEERRLVELDDVLVADAEVGAERVVGGAAEGGKLVERRHRLETVGQREILAELTGAEIKDGTWPDAAGFAHRDQVARVRVREVVEVDEAEPAAGAEADALLRRDTVPRPHPVKDVLLVAGLCLVVDLFGQFAAAEPLARVRPQTAPAAVPLLAAALGSPAPHNPIALEHPQYLEPTPLVEPGGGCPDIGEDAVGGTRGPVQLAAADHQQTSFGERELFAYQGQQLWGQGEQQTQ